MDFDSFITNVSSTIEKLKPGQTVGFKIILDAAITRAVPLNRLAYALATTWWETAKTMEPVREAYYISSTFDGAEGWRKRNLHYYPYYGRGYVQLTWKDNYRKATAKYGHDFVGDPDAVMRPEYAVRILFDGMTEGWFTGKALDDYIDLIDEPDSADLQEYVKARAIINGHDKELEIARIAVKFEAALKAAGYSTTLLKAVSTAMSSKFDDHILSLGLRYFKPYEFLVKGSKNDNSGSPAFGLNTDPPESLWSNIDLTAKVLDELRNQLGRSIVMSSVYRSPAYNVAIGGAKDSQHVQFNAIDFSVKGSPVGPPEWATALRQLRSKGMFEGGIGVYSTFVHVDTRGTNVDWVG